MNFGAHAMVNLPTHLETMARLIRGAEMKPELEVFDLSHVALALHVVEQGHFVARQCGSHLDCRAAGTSPRRPYCSCGVTPQRLRSQAS